VRRGSNPLKPPIGSLGDPVMNEINYDLYCGSSSVMYLKKSMNDFDCW
jgi:hypothetical protein